jgi:hypothetical protein
MPRKRFTDAGEIVEEEISGEEEVALAPSPEDDVLPFIPPPEKDYNFIAKGNVLICNACQNTRHTDPLARKDLCSAADPNCPRNK